MSSPKFLIKLDDIQKRVEIRAQALPQLNLRNVQFINAPLTTTLKPYINTVYNQGSLGSCTANAFCASFNIQNVVNKKYPKFNPSRLYLYYKTRELEGTVTTDSGADVVNGQKYVQQHGICSEQLWPYVERRFAMTPPPSCDIEATKYKIKSYSVMPIDTYLVNNIKTCINKNMPVLIAVLLYTSFYSLSVSKTGVVPLPNLKRETCLGGHEMCIIGYNDTKQVFIVQNSWGIGWGDKGYCYMPYSYITNTKLNLQVTSFTL